MEDRALQWWGPVTLPAGGGARWVLGPMTLWAEHHIREWRVAWAIAPDNHLTETLTHERFEQPPTIPEEARVLRFISEELGRHFTLAPATADRPIVTRPETPVSLLSHQSITLYVSTPLWLTIHQDDPERPLLDVPTFRLSDTWFGPDTRNGELCYASRTSARLVLDEMPIRATRAITEVQIHNLGADPLLLERLKMPMPHFALFADERGALWTQSITVERNARGELGDVRLEPGPPEAVGPTTRVARARERRGWGQLGRTLGGLIR